MKDLYSAKDNLPFIIAEIGINHNGSVEIAKKLIDMAKECRADAVKFQKRTIDVVYSPEVLEYFKSTGAGWQSRMDSVLKDYVSNKGNRS